MLSSLKTSQEEKLPIDRTMTRWIRDLFGEEIYFKLLSTQKQQEISAEKYFKKKDDSKI